MASIYQSRLPTATTSNAGPTTLSTSSSLDMESLNAALHELGMLSAITESRREYLRERTSTVRYRTNSCSASASDSTSASASNRMSDVQHEPADTDRGFCVLHMNSNYVTNLRLKVSANSTAPETTRQRFHRTLPYTRRIKHHTPSSTSAVDVRLKRRNWAQRSKTPCCKLHEIDTGNYRGSSSTSTSTSTSSRDGGSTILFNQSNPGSPEKGSRTRAFQASTSSSLSSQQSSDGLMRSKSLDDIEAIGSIHLEVIVPATTQQTLSKATTRTLDIANMATRLGHLHVN